MSDIPSINLRSLNYSPTVNPLVESQAMTIKRRLVRAGRGEDLINSKTGEIVGVSAIHQIEERDDAEFVKVFAAGVCAAYGLNRTAQRVFQAVLDEYQKTPMRGGYADSVELFWFDGGLSGRDIGMSEKTFQRGLKELLAKGFIAPKTASSFWVNPALFFKGDRVMFIKEYRRRTSSAEASTLEVEGQGQLHLDP